MAEPAAATRPYAYVPWLLLGLLLLFIQALTWVSYFSQPIVAITDYRTPGSLSAQAAPWFEAVYGMFAVVTLAVVGRGVIRRREWTGDAMWVTAFACLIWCDQLINYFRPGFYFSANFTNVASWVTHIPGQIAPHADRVPAPYIWIIGVYIGGFLPMVRLVVKVVERTETRWARRPDWVPPLVALLVINLITLAIELPLLRAGLFAYPAAHHDWAVWGGQRWQYPLIEIVATSVFLYAMYAAMRTEARTGRLACEAGIERIGIAWRRKLAQQLARIGFVVSLFLLFPLGITQIGPWTADPFPGGYAADLHVGWCGDQGQPYGPCPAPGVPWAVRPAP
jgi:hypothetical protein